MNLRSQSNDMLSWNLFAWAASTGLAMGAVAMMAASGIGSVIIVAILAIFIHTLLALGAPDSLAGVGAMAVPFAVLVLLIRLALTATMRRYAHRMSPTINRSTD